MRIRPIPCPAPCQLWQVDLDAAPAAEDLTSLSAAEQARAARFVFARDRERFVAAHAALRRLLSFPAGRPAAELAFAEGEFGKPALLGCPGVQFNMSHSGATALIAIGSDLEIGVDVELERPMPDALQLAAAYFTPGELRALEALPDSRRDRAFLTGWTRKEAFLKALGLGITVDLRRVEVGLQDLDRSVEYSLEAHSCSLRIFSIPLARGAVAAIALQDSKTIKEAIIPQKADFARLQ